MNWLIFSVALVTISAQADLILVEQHGQRVAACPDVKEDTYHLRGCNRNVSRPSCEVCQESTQGSAPLMDILTNLNVLFGIPASVSGLDAIERLTKEIEYLSTEAEDAVTEDDRAEHRNRKTEAMRTQRRLVRLFDMVVRPLRDPKTTVTIDSTTSIFPGGKGDVGLVRAAFDRVFDAKGKIYRITSATSRSENFEFLCEPPFRSATHDEIFGVRTELKKFLISRKELNETSQSSFFWVAERIAQGVTPQLFDVTKGYALSYTHELYTTSLSALCALGKGK